MWRLLGTSRLFLLLSTYFRAGRKITDFTLSPNSQVSISGWGPWGLQNLRVLVLPTRVISEPAGRPRRRTQP
ncbi:hypothetical protein BO94DRAFT_271160 [Aspergillus sclerotioniger CBS 115572]|uniref:Uncharacterized protein n=1 Tax=Aspergillus sclerotioniger CBS 115572 TaxID=1450535 RepID=A0A317VAV8_9EURO|nr:hypothetical protein BO94DRAFT_271160 [Aspergillus sclerotioniger CBS 115572]PWY70391.1 hypothetical protein BO94DRAFT_271160 [Aspergillus sclerotioniger CBS 115572]